MGRKRKGRRRRGKATQTFAEIMQAHNAERDENVSARATKAYGRSREDLWTPSSGRKVITPAEEAENYLRHYCQLCGMANDFCECANGTFGVTTASGGLVKSSAKQSPKKTTWSKWAHACEHWQQAVELAPGITVHCSSWMDRPYKKEQVWNKPDIGIYLDDRWLNGESLASSSWEGPSVGPEYPFCLLDWQDFSTPTSQRQLVKVLNYALDQASRGKFVDIGCHGGHGRTGTALAALWVLLGVDADTAMKRVWSDYCWSAIEMKSQEQFLEELDQQVNPRWFQKGE